ncbi:MAG: hypothetical protein JRI71_07275 [Deltaproteobacteria bacterium]|nr:hypothetical protein [Deltaproteobacteria bacterium]
MEFTIKTKEETYRIEASVNEIGEDLLVAIWGGDRPHIGAVAIAQPRPSLKDRTEISATASVFCYVGHKDDVVAKEAAERISSALNTNVVVAAGIHWDDIDEAGINAIIENSRHLVEMIIERVPMREPR